MTTHQEAAHNLSEIAELRSNTMLESKVQNNEMNLHELNVDDNDEDSPGKENNPLLGSATFNMSIMSKKLEEVTVSNKPPG